MAVESSTTYQAPPAVIHPSENYTSVTSKIGSLLLTRRTPRGWIFAFLAAFALLQGLLFGASYLFVKGVGIWGINIPVGWGFAIINFVWWIGIGHAGTLISAILLLFKQQWRMAISRFSEAMTLFAVACAGMYPLMHLGRPWLFYWLLPYPNAMGTWPQFRSPLEWDCFAVSTYATVSLLFWFVGLVPDLAAMRDRAQSPFVKKLFGVLCLGWRGSARHWHRFEVAALVLAGLATPLVVSVHTVVSFDFAMGIIPGWHTTVFPPFFVAGAIYSGFSMVLSILIPVRSFYKLQNLITQRHLQNMAKTMLATGIIVAYGYIMETFMAWYSGNTFDQFMIHNREIGPYAPVYWSLILCNILVPQLLWIKKVRANIYSLWVVAMFINVGMWIERFIIVITSLHRDFLPSSWGMFYPTFWDWAIFIGTIGFFLTLMFLFIRGLPIISIFEMRTLVPKKPREAAEGAAS